MAIVINAITNIVRSFLDYLNVQPTETYGFLFPPEIDSAVIIQMVKDKVFPTLSGLAPATTYFILFSVARLVLNGLVFRVSNACVSVLA